MYQETCFPPSVPINCGAVNEQGLRNFLMKEGFPRGLHSLVYETLSKIPIRFIIADDSGSMCSNDGRRVMIYGNQAKVVSCSRWTELTESLKFHANFAHSAGAVTEFRFLNSCEPIIVGLPDDGLGLKKALQAFSSISPNGGTPLCRHIRAVVDQIRLLEPQLRQNGQKVVLTVATDGESSDGDVSSALKDLVNLPVLLVIRLCTDESNICEYWNSIDNDLELSIDVLDDIKSEAEEVYQHNKWLTYGEPLHLLREFGMSSKEFDLLDEKKLSMDQMRFMCALLVGDGCKDELPHPDMNWSGFVEAVKRLSASAPKVYNHHRNCMKPWIDVNMLARCYHPTSCNMCVLS